MRTELLVVFGSRYGHSEKYARWTAQSLECSAIPASELTEDLASRASVIVLVGGIYLTTLLGAEELTAVSAELDGAKVAVAMVGISPVTDESRLSDVMPANFTPAQLRSYRFFQLRGGIDFRSLKFRDKMLMRAGRAALKAQLGSKTGADSVGSVHRRSHDVDYCDPANLGPLLRWVRGQ